MMKAHGSLSKIALSLLLGLSLAGCFSLSGDLDDTASVSNNAQPRMRNTLRGQVLENPEEQIQVRLPRGWEIASPQALNDRADLYAYSPDRQIYFLVLGEDANSVSYYNLQDNAREYRRLLASRFENAGQEEVTELQAIAGDPAIQYLVRGQIEGTPVAYLHTTVAANNRYYQVVAWTPETQYNENRDEMQTVIASFEHS
ncbi:MAG TPA: hypothetical protein V6D06_15025 [Trichocoleus sp.]